MKSERSVHLISKSSTAAQLMNGPKKVKSSMARSLPVENQQPCTEFGVNYQLLAVIF